MDRPYVIDTAPGPAPQEPGARLAHHALANFGAAPLATIAGLVGEDVVVSSLVGAAPPVHGRDAALEAAQPWLGSVPDATVRVVRLIGHGYDVVAELEVTGRSVDDVGPRSAPLLLWATFTAGGQVSEAAIAFAWERRRFSDHSEPAVPEPGVPEEPDGEAAGPVVRSQGRYRELAERFAEAWSWDPEVAARSAFADRCLLSQAGDPATAVPTTIPSTSRSTLVVDGVLGEGSTMAVRFSLRPSANPARPSRETSGDTTKGVLLVGLDDDDRFCWLRRFGVAGPGPADSAT